MKLRSGKSTSTSENIIFKIISDPVSKPVISRKKQQLPLQLSNIKKNESNVTPIQRKLSGLLSEYEILSKKQDSHIMLTLNQILQLSKIIDTSIELIRLLDPNSSSAMRFVCTVSTKVIQWLDSILRKRCCISSFYGNSILRDFAYKVLVINAEIMKFNPSKIEEIMRKVNEVNKTFGL